MIEQLVQEMNRLVDVDAKYKSLWNSLWWIITSNDVKWTEEEARQGVEYIISRYIAELKAGKCK